LVELRSTYVVLCSASEVCSLLAFYPHHFLSIVYAMAIHDSHRTGQARQGGKGGVIKIQ